jgi:hypothetical protein
LITGYRAFLFLGDEFTSPPRKRATTMKRAILATTLLTLALALPAQAQHGSLTRSFVSSSGLDTNACTITAPCATFAVAYTKISANGIIAALDPGKYGPLTGTSAITGPVTINGNGWAAITGPANGIAITVNAGPNDTVKLSAWKSTELMPQLMASPLAAENP